MAARREITKKYTREYGAASKKERGRMLDELVAATGWSRAKHISTTRCMSTCSRPIHA